MPGIDAAPSSLRLRSPWTIVIALGAIAGVVVRVAMIRSPTGVLDGDEAVVGLMARHFAHGSYRAFFWGQSYGGTVETALTSLVFRVFGSSTAALKAVPAALDGIAAILVWRIGRRLMRPEGAVVAALLVWLWPANYLWWSIKARGFYEATLCITLACALIVLRIGQDRDGDRWLDWAILGLLAGLGWWQTPQVLYILAPAGLWLVVARRGAVLKAAAVIPGLLLGALPWLVANLQDGFASLTAPPAVVKGTYADHLLTFVRLGLPMTFGLKYVYLPFWIGSVHVSLLVYALGCAVAVAGILQRQRGSVFLGGIILAYPLIHALLTLSSEVAEGRYTLFLMPWLAIALARACQRRSATLGALLVVTLAVSFVGVRDLHGQTSPYAPDRRVPASMASLQRSLDDHGVNLVWANYWVAYRLTFESRERIIAASALTPRYPAYNDEVERGHGVGYVFVAGSRDIGRFRQWLVTRQVRFNEWAVDRSFVVFVPEDGKVLPSIVPGISL